VRANSDRPGRGGAGRSQRSSTRFAALIAAAVAAVLLAAGCSSASSGGSSPSAATSASASAAGGGTNGTLPPGASPAPTGTVPASDVGITASTIKVGIIADINNPLVPGLFQDSVNAVKAWATNVNASGGLDGRKVQVDFCDSQLNPNSTTSCVIKACQTDFALVGTSANALGDLADLDGCKDAAGKAIGIANLTAFAFPPLTCDPVTYLASGLGPYCKTAKATPQTYTVPVGDTQYLVAHNKNLHGIWLYDSDDATFKITQTPLFEAESNLGIKKDGQGYYAVSGAAPQSALTPFIQQIKSSQSTFVYDDVTTSAMVLLRREAQLQGVNSVKVWECNSGCYDPSFYTQGGATVNGTYAMLLDLPYLSDYKANPALNKIVTALGGTANFNNNAENSLIEAYLFQDAVEKEVATGKPLNRASLFTALKAEHAFDAQGITGPTDVGQHETSNCEVLVQLQNGVWNRVDPTQPGTFDCNKANLATLKMSVS
jgi:ABC-type branched-subunit amino acid transport system substrate-binding protein